MKNDKKQIKMKISFIFAILSFCSIFAASASPIPLYSVYQESINLTKSEISLTAVFYFMGCIVSLIFFSKLSNYLGRKPIATASVVLSIIGLLLLIYTKQAFMLMEARFFQGLSCGLESSVMSVYIFESGENISDELISAITGSIAFIGLALGAVLSGGVVQFFSGSEKMVYFILLFILLFCGLGLLCGIETVIKSNGALKSLVPKIFIPNQSKPFFSASVTIFVGTWAMGGYFQAFSSTISHEVFNKNSPLVAAIILSTFMIPNFIGGSLSSKFTVINSQKFGIALFTSSISVMYVSILIKNLPLFLIIIFIGGVAQGICYTSAIQSLVSNISSEERAGIMAIIYLSSYGGASIPNLISSQVSKVLSFQIITLGYLLLVIFMMILTLISLKNKSKFYLNLK